VRFKENRDLPRAAEGIESPYDVDARYRHKHGTSWTGYMVHVSETCDPTHPHLLTQVHTTSAAVHEASCTEVIQQALVDKDLAPTEHLVDGAYIDAELLLTSQQAQGITLRGPTRPIQGWQTQVEGTLSQGVRAFGLRRTRYRGLDKTHLQHVATAAAINIDRIVAWLDERPRAKTRTSRFAALAPVHDLTSEPPAV
jgi:IS5 family transposase